MSEPREPQASPRIKLAKNQDRRVRAGHPWIFSNEIEGTQGAPRPGDLVDVLDVRGAFLGRAYWNPQSLICARILTRGRDTIDTEFFVKRIERALALRAELLAEREKLLCRARIGHADLADLHCGHFNPSPSPAPRS